MEPILIIILLFVLVSFASLFWFVIRQKHPKGSDQGFVMLQNQIHELSRKVEASLKDVSKNVTDSTKWQVGESQKIIKDTTERLIKLDEATKHVIGFGDQLKQLQDILQNPKQRGSLGEHQLEVILSNVLPPGHYKMQYQFKDGKIVDAVVFYQGKIIPIDSKFSLENYKRVLKAETDEERKRYADAFRKDLKLRIDETAKYIKPEENTVENALMFIPSEAIYYDLLINKVGAVREHTVDLIEYSNQKHVSIVSPTTFLVILKMVLQGLRQIEFNKSAEKIRKNVLKLGDHIAKYDTYMQKLGGHLGTTVRSYDTAYKELKKIDKDVLRIGGKSAGIEPLVLEKPLQEDE